MMNCWMKRRRKRVCALSVASFCNSSVDCGIANGNYGGGNGPDWNPKNGAVCDFGFFRVFADNKWDVK